MNGFLPVLQANKRTQAVLRGAAAASTHRSALPTPVCSYQLLFAELPTPICSYQLLFAEATTAQRRTRLKRARADLSFEEHAFFQRPIRSSCRSAQLSAPLTSGPHPFTQGGCKSARILSSHGVLPVNIHKQSG